MRLISNRRIIILILASALGLILIGATFFGLLQLVNSDKMVYGLRVAGLKIGGIKLEQAKNILANQITEFKQREIVFVFAEKEWRFTPEQLGAYFDLEKTFNQAAYLGRKSNIFSGTEEQIMSLLFGKKLPVNVSIDSEQFNRALATISVIEKPTQNAKLVYNPRKNDFDILPEAPGQIIDRTQLKKHLLDNFSQLSALSIKLSLIEDPPAVSAQNLQSVKKEAEKMIERSPHYLKTAQLSWPIDKQELTQWIATLPHSDDLTLDENEIADFLTQIAPSTNKEPVNAKLSFVDDKIKVFSLSQSGQKINIEESVQKITAGIMKGEKNIELVLDSIEPEITTESIDTLGLTSLLGQGESNFAGSPNNRKYNINLGASRLNGFLIKPGEEFSFNETIGSIDEKSGYLPELVIKNKKTIPEYGGGLCQISTTLFRAAINAGLKIIERYPHAYPVRYYNPPGFDATVYPPKPDLKFINDTPAYILLQNKIEGNKLIFEIYGTDDNRQVKVKGPTITQSNPDGSLKTILMQEIWRDDQLERQDIFLSNYKSPALYPVATSTPDI